MPTFFTPQPIDVLLQIVVGTVRITASDRTDTVVEIRPSSELTTIDVAAAEQIRVEMTDGRLEIKPIKSWKLLRLMSGSGSLDVAIDVPTGTRIEGDLGMGSFRSDGELGRSRFRTGMGDIRLDHVGAAHIKTGYGDVDIDVIAGDADIATGSGRIRIGTIEGDAALRNANGATEIGTSLAELRVKSSSGTIDVGRAASWATLKSAAGRIQLDEVVHGTVVAETGHGKVQVGVRVGTAAWLDLATQHGDVRNGLESSDAPAESDDTVEVRARTGHGDIVVTRSIPSEPEPGTQSEPGTTTETSQA